VTEDVTIRTIPGSRPPCAVCHHPFADPDIVVLVFDPGPIADDAPARGFYHVPCYERADRLGDHRSVIGVTYDDERLLDADVDRQISEFAIYIQARALGETAELDDDELEARWPLAMHLIASQRTRRYGSAN
jgi:hypothetical protein